MKIKIHTQKDFEAFKSFMLDESTKKQNERAKIYEEYGGLDPIYKAKYIVEKIGPYIYSLVSKIEEDVDEVDYKDVLDELQVCFSGIKEMLKAKEQISAFEVEFKSLSFSDKFEHLESKLSNHKKDIFKFTNLMFKTIFEDLNDSNKNVDVLSLRKYITSEEVYKYITSSNRDVSILSQEQLDVSNILIRALERQQVAVNTEIIGRVYAYVKSGWATSDLIDKDGVSNNPTLQKFNEVISKVRKNPKGKTQEEKEKNDELLSQLFTERLNQIAVNIIYDKDNGTCYAKPASFQKDKTAQAATSDIAILDKNNPGNLIQVYCTANQSLYMTEDASQSNSMFTHQVINNSYLIGKSLKQVDVSNTERQLSKIIDENQFNQPITNVEVINIAPGILAKEKSIAHYSEVFKRGKGLKAKEISLINQFPMLRIIFNYIPNNDRNQKLSINDILRLNENIILNDKRDKNVWDELSMQIKIYGDTDKRKEDIFYNRFLIDYVDDLWSIIKDRELKDNFVIYNQSSSRVDGAATYFIKELPEFLRNISYQIISNDKYSLFNKQNTEKFVEILEEITNHPNFKSSTTVSRTLFDLSRDCQDIKKQFEDQSYKDVAKSIIKRVKK